MSRHDELQAATVELAFQGQRFSIASLIRTIGQELLVCLHGLGCSKEYFAGISSCRDLDRFSLLIPDLPGFGASAAPDSFSYNLAEVAEICRMIITNIDARNIYIVGHSMGGAIGVLLAETLGEKVGGFANVEGTLIYQDRRVHAASEPMDYNEYQRIHLPAVITVTSLSDEKGTREWSKSLERANPVALFQSMRSLDEWASSGRLIQSFNRLHCRKRYIVGEKNARHPVIPYLEGVAVKIIPGSGHFPMIDNPSAFYEAVAEVCAAK